jgi:hypothetical protein
MNKRRKARKPTMHRLSRLARGDSIGVARGRGMLVTVERPILLERHPSTPSEVVRAIQVSVRRSERELQIAYRLDGDIQGIRIPPARAPHLGHELWRHTCFEAFIAVPGQSAYHEFNFAPSGEWTIYGFRGYRDGSPLADESMRPDIAIRSTSRGLELDATVRLDWLSDVHPRASLRVGLAAIIETAGGLSYWALRHSAGKPDFHDPAGFALLLAPPRVID